MPATRRAAALAGVALLAFAAACGGNSPQNTAERLTKSVYANDLDTTVAAFDDATKAKVSRAELGALSDKMHALGTFVSLSQRSAKPDSGQYEFDATFSGGKMLVLLRLDPDGKVGAFRIAPEPATSASG